jgi:hypothetical protein
VRWRGLSPQVRARLGALIREYTLDERARVRESNRPDYALPTTGVVGKELSYVANTQIDRMVARDKSDPVPNSET